MVVELEKSEGSEKEAIVIPKSCPLILPSVSPMSYPLLPWETRTWCDFSEAGEVACDWGGHRSRDPKLPRRDI